VLLACQEPLQSRLCSCSWLLGVPPPPRQAFEDLLRAPYVLGDRISGWHEVRGMEPFKLPPAGTCTSYGRKQV
jgi:hypothetical protein